MRSDYGPLNIIFLVIGFFLGMLVMFTSVILHEAKAEPQVPDLANEKPERIFIESMLRENEDALVVAGALFISEQPSHPEAFFLAQDILESRRSESEKLRIWLRDWYGIEKEVTLREAAVPVVAPVDIP